MANENKLDNLYKDFKKDNILSNGSQDAKAIYNSLQSGKRIARVDRNFVEANIDIKWVEEIEKCIIPLDNVVRNPGRFIKKDEEIIPIELARNIDSDSVKHLSQHTNYIQSVDNRRGTVTPKKILNSFKEESVDTYENRFIYTLLINLNYFIDKRLEIILNSNGTNEYSIRYENRVMIGDDDYHVRIELQATSNRNARINDIDKLINANVEKMSIIQRINRVRQIIYDFQATQFFKSMEGTPKVRSPLQMTNKLMKNVDYQACVNLWGFIQTYDDKGVVLNSVKLNSEASKGAIDDLDLVSSELFVLLKKHTGTVSSHIVDPNYSSYTLETQSKSSIADQAILKLMNELKLSTNDIRRTFLDRIDLANKKSQRTKRTLSEIISRTIKLEKEKEKQYLAKLKLDKKKKLIKESKLEDLKIEKREKMLLERVKKNAILKVNNYKDTTNLSKNSKLNYKIYQKEALKAIQECKQREDVKVVLHTFKEKVSKLKINPFLGRNKGYKKGKEVKVENSKEFVNA